MRLSCPTCGARYEVADRLIPIEGRDVQCSRCATTWFQPGLRGLGGAGIPPGGPPPASDDPVAAAGPDPWPVPQDDGLPDEDGPLETVLPPRREIDPAILAILREEAEREARLRRAEAELRAARADAAKARAPDAPGDAPPPAASFLRRGSSGADSPEIGQPAVAHATLPDTDQTNAPSDGSDGGDLSDGGAEAGPAAPPPAASFLRRGSLGADSSEIGHPAVARDASPDTDQTNVRSDVGDLSGGAADAGPAAPPEAPAPDQRKAVRLGFGLALAITAGAVALYGLADPISARAPALAPMLEVYSGALDAARFWLDGVARRLMGAPGAA